MITVLTVRSHAPLYPAVRGVSQDVYLIKHKKIIGIGTAVSMKGDLWAGIRMKDERAIEYVKEHRWVQALGIRHVNFRFDPITGIYIGGNFSDETEEDSAPFEDVQVVGKYEFDIGLAHGFEDVEGYGAMLYKD